MITYDIDDPVYTLYLLLCIVLIGFIYGKIIGYVELFFIRKEKEKYDMRLKEGYGRNKGNKNKKDN